MGKICTYVQSWIGSPSHGAGRLSKRLCCPDLREQKINVKYIKSSCFWKVGVENGTTLELPAPMPCWSHLSDLRATFQALRAALELKCKCHGVSGSCSIRTCWRGLQDLKDIAMDLKTKYLSATKVVHRPMGTRKQLVPKDIDIRPVRENELVYLQSSPDFCTKNDKLGSIGTQDR